MTIGHGRSSDEQRFLDRVRSDTILDRSTRLEPHLQIVRPDLHSSIMIERLLQHTLTLSAAHSAVLFWVGPDGEWIDPQSANVCLSHVDAYLGSAYRRDPLHITRLRDQGRRIAALRHEQMLDPGVIDADYLAYLCSIDVGDEIDLVFWRQGRPFACLGLMRNRRQPPFLLDGFDWEALHDFIQATLRLHWRTRAMFVEDFLVRRVGLKPRELDIVRHVLMGKDNSQIAASLGITVGTVKTHVVSILDKTGVDSRLAIACFVHDLQTRLN